MAEEKTSESIFRRYYESRPFVDRYQSEPEGAVDVLIPLIHANELWHANLSSMYREVPVHRLIIGDGGCIDGSVDVARGFPRVNVLDHRSFISLGYSIRKLIEAVETEWFVYAHSDVFLPEGWFEAMRGHQREYDWFGCPQRITALVEYTNVDRMFGETRPYAGSQMGRRAAFASGLSRIDDDFVYRQEDYVFAAMVADAGFKEGRIEDTFHYHQMMHKEGPWARTLKRVSVEVELSVEERRRAAEMQVKGIIKYLRPSHSLSRETEEQILRLLDLDSLDLRELRRWVRKVNPLWLHRMYRPWYLTLARLLRASLWRTALRRIFG
jgi:hypothetical protein